MDTNKMRNDLPSLIKQSFESHPGYREFAAWCESEQMHPYPIYFLIWQASRAAAVVELPNRASEDYREEFDDVEGGSFNEAAYIRDVRKAIEAQGLRVAP